MALNECIPYFEPGERVTADSSAAVTGKRMVKISGNQESGPGLSSTAEGGNYRVAHADAAGMAFGVAAHDAAINEKVAILASPGMIVPVTAGANIAAGVEVEVGTNGQVVTYSAGIKVGMCLTAATSGNDAQIKLY